MFKKVILPSNYLCSNVLFRDLYSHVLKVTLQAINVQMSIIRDLYSSGLRQYFSLTLLCN